MCGASVPGKLPANQLRPEKLSFFSFVVGFQGLQLFLFKAAAVSGACEQADFFINTDAAARVGNPASGFGRQPLGLLSKLNQRRSIIKL